MATRVRGHFEEFGAAGRRRRLGRSPPAGRLDRPATAGRTGRPATRLALLAAVSPHAVTHADVAAWRGRGPASDPDLRLLAFGAMTAVDRIEAVISGRNVPSAEP
ncbi:MAG TPA: hypothetical protein VHA75_00480, partial [Rugosimonospora sp.]|nr:hypothetical protein [Rugosimonospora sp.]